MAVPDSPPPKEDFGMQDYLDYPYVTCSTRLQQEQLFVEDFIQTQIDEEESYMMVDFGEFSNEMLLVPCQPSMDYHQLEKVMLESSFYPPLTREIQIGEVLAVPKKYYNRTKLVRAVVLKIKGDKLKVRGLDFSYRCYVNRSEVRMLSPDSISIPLKCICINLHHVDKVERQRFKPFLTSLLNRLLSKPLSVTLKSRDPSIRISEAGSGEVEPNTWTPNVILQTHETEGSFCTINLLLQHELNRPLPKELLGLSEPVDSSSLKSSCAPPTPEKIITKFISNKHFQSLQIGKEYEVVILQIFSPSLISVLPVHKMEEVTRRVHKYNKRATMQQDFLLDDDNSNGVQLGQVCMARGQDDIIWYRALVVAVPNQHTVKVLLLDTGVLRKVPSASLKKLNQEYAKNFSVYFCSLAEGWDECAEETWGNVRPTKISGNEQMKLTWQGSLSAAHKSQHNNNENLSRLLKEEARKLLPESSHQILKILNVDRALHTVEVSSFQQ